ncbi:hypothetical protein [Enterobacter cancerogenus]|uniref:hypothetical protein n=1 Tax=Enterobacter cancerogenus TaxID=69218 RepID=UPI00405A3058
MEQVKRKEDITSIFKSLNRRISNKELFSEILKNHNVSDLNITGLELPPGLSLHRVDGRRGYGNQSFEIVLLDRVGERILYYLFVTPSYQVIFEGKNVMQAFSWRSLWPANDELISHVCNRIFDEYLLHRFRIAVLAINAELEGMSFWTKRILSSLSNGHPVYAYDLNTSECYSIQDELSVLQEWSLWLWQDKKKAINRVALLGE